MDTTKPITIQTVALALGMNKSTVSQALSGKGNVSARTRLRVQAAAREMGYEPNPLAQRLANGFVNDLVCLFCGILDTGLATVKALAIQQELAERGWEAPLYACPRTARDPAHTQAAQMKLMRRQRPRAIICATPVEGEAVFAQLAAYGREGGLVVSYDTPTPLECDQVIFDREDNAYRAARYLLERGHRRIGVGMSKMPGASGGESNPQTHRLRGYTRALGEYGLALRDDWQFRNESYERGGQALAAQFLAMTDRPTALCVVNDYVALACMTEVMRAGVPVPGDLSLIGHDNQPVAALCPVPLTTTTQPTDRIAQSVVHLLTTRLDGTAEGSPPRRIVIQGDLVERGSVAGVG